MARVKSILKRMELETVKTKRTCKNSGVKMTAGDVCLVVYDGMFENAPYCRDVALQMIEAAREKLDQLEEALEVDAAVK